MSSFAEKFKSAADAESSKELPKQKLAHFIRRVLQWSVLPFVWIESGVQTLFKRGLSRSKIYGRCIQNGACCKTIVVYLSALEMRVWWLQKLTMWWAVEVNGFYEKANQLEVIEGDLRVFSCRHLKENGLCADYWVRPSVCRSWPRQEYFKPSRVFKGCGFEFVDKKSGSSAGKSLPVVNDVR